MSRIVEPVICLIGETVVGDPTQFIMERLAADSQIEWRFVTAEVASDRLAVAVSGIRALNFEGIAFISPVSTDSKLPFDSVAESALVSNQITAARRDGLNWMAENLDGAAIAMHLEVLLEQYPDPESKVVVYGDMVLANLLRLAMPQIAERLVAISLDHDSPTSVENGGTNGAGTTSPMIQRMSRHEIADSPVKIAVLVASAPLTTLDVSLIRQCKLSENASAIVHFRSEQSVVEHNKEMLSEFSWAESTQILAATYASMFQFWTGRNANQAIVRDSLDEYMQW